MSTTTEKPPRKFPPPCWTQDETLALIEAYRERWYALRRGYLRTADWEAVAAAVARSCPDASPAKTSAQCRHKMEKLRQRYRAEKQRSLSYPGRFFSSWFFFDNMDSMENGTSLTAGSNQATEDRLDSGNGSLIKSPFDQNLVTLGSVSRVTKQIDGNSIPNLAFDHGGTDRNSVPLGFRAKNCSKIDDKPSRTFGSRGLNGYSPYLDMGSDEDRDDGIDFGGGFRVKTPIDRNSVPPGFRAKKIGNIYGNLKPKFDSNHSGGDTVDAGVGFRVKPPFDQDSVHPGFRARKIGKIDGKFHPNFDCHDGAYNGIDADGEFWVKIPGDRNSLPPGLRGKYSGKVDGNSNPNLDSSVLNGFSSRSRLVFGRKNGGGVKSGRSSVAEMVSSIKLLGEGFVKMEKMKMEMAREIEKMRMEMEMKRNELILESQQQIVDAFVKGLFENKNKKVETVVSPES